jgi:hypothetical protein
MNSKALLPLEDEAVCNAPCLSGRLKFNSIHSARTRIDENQHALNTPHRQLD